MQSGMTKAQAQQVQRTKLADSYGQLLEEFASPDLRTVGNYTLGRLIGKGSFGKVYLATHKLTNGSKVVLKSANKDDANLAREIHHHRQFVHPHIARLYEVLVTESLVWLVLEYCPGDELYNRLLKTGPMEPEKVQKIFTQLVGAVSYVHQKSCVHRDLKLENILLDKQENVKLVDFGFTREYEGKMSYLQTWCGTVCYSAPEMIKGEKYAGEKVDVWSLGIILYALLCGELPFDDDDETATRQRILKEEPKYPEHVPLQAKELIASLLSKRPILRPTLADILQHAWLTEHAPAQQAILKLQQPAPFSTDLEKEVLQRMRASGVNIDTVIENVLAQRCDALAGWWTLLLEKEERKAKRRERKRKEAEAKGLRRLSAASSRLERIAPTIQELDENSLTVPILGEPPRPRGRNPNRRSGPVAAAAPDLPNLPEASSTSGAEDLRRPPPVDKDSIRSASSSRPPPPPKETRVSRASLLQVVQTNPDLLSPSNGTVPGRRKRYHPFFSQLAQLKHWFKESTKKAASPIASRSRPGTAKPTPPNPTNHNRRVSRVSASSTYRYSNSHVRPEIRDRTSSNYNQIPLPPGPGSGKRLSLSPSPLTPRSSSYRRSSTGLRGRKSTSSSVSSIRSIHHQHSHSRATSTSSASVSIASPTGSSSVRIGGSRSPHTSVKVLPATPQDSAFPSNIRVVRKPLAISTEGKAAFSTLPPSSPGIMFAKRKRSPFKGPMLSLSTGSGKGRADSLSRSSSLRRRSGEVIQEEDEDEEEEVDEFSPIKPGEDIVEITEAAMR
ncbi:kinase-like protein [Microthyrium microscopicum]|uniref:Kinase-like protein n=1 Tax=Microthyrium microscopicum TaxID=703497 RepID=A0A6A6U2N4_9PEZI|nr:kinase-like protein [Microthyrium microscopicum]